MGDLQALSAWLSLQGQSPLTQAVLVVLGTFVLEDAATILAAMDVQVGHVAAWVAILALYAGIILGDLGLYGLGRLAATTPWARRWAPGASLRHGPETLQRHVVKAVFISRFLPGARLPTYTACGFFHADFVKFALAAVGATLIWTTLLFGVSLRVGAWLVHYLGAWQWVGMVGFAVVVIVLLRLSARLPEAHR